MNRWLKLIHHSHTGSVQPHEHTSYVSLAILLILVGSVLSYYSVSAATPYMGPESGSIGLTGTVPAKPPTVAATIAKPTNNQRFDQTPIEVSGTCLENTLVELFKNNIFAGSTTCDDTGNYSLQIDLLIGKNKLIARIYDELNQAGPDSNPVIVYYDGVSEFGAPLSSENFGSTQLILSTNAVFRGIFPEKNLAVPIDILGGTPPYALNIQWGDSENKVVSRSNNLTFSISHKYAKPGTYQISIQATDADDQVAFLTIPVIVNGQPEPASGSTDGEANSGGFNTQMLVLWPVFTSTTTAVVSFWLGERRERKLLAKRAKNIS